jgi:hypothetical protein
MHWQQYTILAVFALGVFYELWQMNGAVYASTLRSHLINLAALIAVQFVLWSGGFYPNW